MQGAVRSAASNSNEVYAVPHFPNFRLMWKVCGLPAVSQATFTRTPLCTRFNRSPIARAFGLTCIRIQGLVMLLFYTARLPSSFGSFGANNPTRTDNRLITNQLRYRLRHISVLRGLASYHPSVPHLAIGFVRFLFVHDKHRQTRVAISEGYREPSA